jgi:surface antigen
MKNEHAALAAEAKELGEKLVTLSEKALEVGDTGHDINWNTARHYGQILAAGPGREPAAE